MTARMHPAARSLTRRGLLGLSTGAALAAAGCGGSVTGNANSATDSAAPSGSAAAGGGGTPTTITTWHQATDAGAKEIAAIVKDYNASQTNYNVALQFVAGTSDQFGPKLVSAITNGQGPDFVFSYAEPAEMGQIIATDKVVQLDSLLATGRNPVDKTKIPPGMLASSRFDDKLYSLPTDGGDYGFLYNKKMFAEAGLTTPPTTWAEVATYAKKLTKKGQYGIYLPISSNEWTVWTWESMLWSGGGEFLNADNTKVLFNSPAGVNGLKTWVDLITSGVAYPTSLSTTNTDAGAAGFTAGKFAMFIDGAYDLGLVDGTLGQANVGTFAFPKVSVPAMNTGTDVSFILNTTPAAAKGGWDFLSWFMQGPQMARWDVATGFLPCYTTAEDVPAFKAYVAKDDRLQVFIDELAYAKTRPSIAAYTEISQAIGQQLEKALLQKISPADAIATAAKQAQTILDKANKA